MKKLKKLSDFQIENCEAISTLEMVTIKGGKLPAAECCNESWSTQCPDGAGSDTESWIYSDANGGRVPLEGYLDGDQIYP